MPHAVLDYHVVRQVAELTKSLRSRPGSRTACRLQPLLQSVASPGTEGPQRAVKPLLPCIAMAALSSSPDLPEATPVCAVSVQPRHPSSEIRSYAANRVKCSYSPWCLLRKINAPATSKGNEKAHGSPSGGAGRRSARPFLSEARI